MAYYLNCIDNINTNIINNLSTVSKNKCDKEKKSIKKIITMILLFKFLIL